MIQHAHKNKVTVLEHVGSQGLPKAIFLFIMEGNSKLYWAPWHRLCWWIPDHHCMITFLLVSIWKRKQFENQGFSLALETSGDSQLLNILLVLVKFCRTQSLHSSCCQELSVLMKRDEQERSTPGAGPMENVFSALGIAGGDLDPRRNAVSFSICGEKKQGFSQHELLSHLGFCGPCGLQFILAHLAQGWDGYMRQDRKVVGNIAMTPRKTPRLWDSHAGGPGGWCQAPHLWRSGWCKINRGKGWTGM